MSTIQTIPEQARDTALLAHFVAEARSARPLAWQSVERLKAACAQIESERRTHGDRIEPGRER